MESNTKPHILEVSPSAKWIGVLDHNIVSFDVVMETRYGTTYNSYFIDGPVKAVVETVKESFWPEYERKLRALTDPAEIRYIILNHSEPDHSSSIGHLLGIAPSAEVVATGNAIRNLKEILSRDFPHRAVKDGDTLALGDRVLRFIGAPNLHWPDTMYTWLEDEGLLFTCDSFGAHYADANMFDDRVDPIAFDEAFKYYFDVILKPFSKFMLKALDKIADLPVRTICTGHGPILRSDWKKYVELSRKWSEEYLRYPEQQRVYIAYVSAYHMTGVIAEELARGIRDAGPIEVEVMDIETTDIGEMEEQLTRATGLLVGSPVINQNILLPVYKLFAAVNPLRDRGKLAGGFGSYGWSGENEKLIRISLENLKLNYHGEGLFFKFTPDAAELQQSYAYGRSFGEALLSTAASAE
ncbi:MAG TPA: FprA family A-type flavoprotein [Bacteroidales bacterium]|nr:FprA family A-type flavoprotein [Bacteroidales bacterium]HRZ76684.1 FprA family A-type flavoprotein [Bacteroidales bacterium]